MSITMEDYLRRGHIYLGTKQGRDKVFTMFAEDIEREFESGQIQNAVAIFRVITSYLEGNAFIFIDSNIPNVFKLREKKGEIREHSLRFLKEIIESMLLRKVYMAANRWDHKYDILYLLVKYIQEFPDLHLKHFTDLYLLMFHTLLYLDTFEGKEKEIFELGDLTIRALCRYDAVGCGEYLLKDLRLKESLKKYSFEYVPYEKYVKRLRDVVRRMEKVGVNIEDFTPLIFTDKLFALLNSEHNGLLDKLFRENKEEIFSYLKSRCNDLFEKGEEKQRILIDLGVIIEEVMKKVRIKVHPYNTPGESTLISSRNLSSLSR